MAESTTPPTDLAWYVEAIGEDAPFATASAAEATALVMNFIGADNPYGVPEVIVARVVLEVGADLFYRKASRNGIVGFEGIEAQPMRVNRDPMAAAYPILRQYIPVGL
jgi:hypothetical protein